LLDWLLLVLLLVLLLLCTGASLSLHFLCTQHCIPGALASFTRC
jgi:hypothetical protein